MDWDDPERFAKYQSVDEVEDDIVVEWAMQHLDQLRFTHTESLIDYANEYYGGNDI